MILLLQSIWSTPEYTRAFNNSVLNNLRVNVLAVDKSFQAATHQSLCLYGFWRDQMQLIKECCQKITVNPQIILRFLPHEQDNFLDFLRIQAPENKALPHTLLTMRGISWLLMSLLLDKIPNPQFALDTDPICTIDLQTCHAHYHDCLFDFHHRYHNLITGLLESMCEHAGISEEQKQCLRKIHTNSAIINRYYGDFSNTSQVLSHNEQDIMMQCTWYTQAASIYQHFFNLADQFKNYIDTHRMTAYYIDRYNLHNVATRNLMTSPDFLRLVFTLNTPFQLVEFIKEKHKQLIKDGGFVLDATYWNLLITNKNFRNQVVCHIQNLFSETKTTGRLLKCGYFSHQSNESFLKIHSVQGQENMTDVLSNHIAYFDQTLLLHSAAFNSTITIKLGNQDFFEFLFSVPHTSTCPLFECEQATPPLGFRMTRNPKDLKQWARSSRPLSMVSDFNYKWGISIEGIPHNTFCACVSRSVLLVAQIIWSQANNMQAYFVTKEKPKKHKTKAPQAALAHEAPKKEQLPKEDKIVWDTIEGKNDDGPYSYTANNTPELNGFFQNLMVKMYHHDQAIFSFLNQLSEQEKLLMRLQEIKESNQAEETWHKLQNICEKQGAMAGLYALLNLDDMDLSKNAKAKLQKQAQQFMQNLKNISDLDTRLIEELEKNLCKYPNIINNLFKNPDSDSCQDLYDLFLTIISWPLFDDQDQITEQIVNLKTAAAHTQQAKEEEKRQESHALAEALKKQADETRAQKIAEEKARQKALRQRKEEQKKAQEQARQEAKEKRQRVLDAKKQRAQQQIEEALLKKVTREAQKKQRQEQMEKTQGAQKILKQFISNLQVQMQDLLQNYNLEQLRLLDLKATLFTQAAHNIAQHKLELLHQHQEKQKRLIHEAIGCNLSNNILKKLEKYIDDLLAYKKQVIDFDPKYSQKVIKILNKFAKKIMGKKVYFYPLGSLMRGNMTLESDIEGFLWQDSRTEVWPEITDTIKNRIGFFHKLVFDKNYCGFKEDKEGTFPHVTGQALPPILNAFMLNNLIVCGIEHTCNWSDSFFKNLSNYNPTYAILSDMIDEQKPYYKSPIFRLRQLLGNFVRMLFCQAYMNFFDPQILLSHGFKILNHKRKLFQKYKETHANSPLLAKRQAVIEPEIQWAQDTLALYYQKRASELGILKQQSGQLSNQIKW